MRTIDDLADQLGEIALELQEAARDEMTRTEARTMSAAGDRCEGAVAILLALGEQMHARKVADLAVLCRCGHDRGEHLVDAPHACERVETLSADVAGGELVDPCLCRGFHPVRVRTDTLPSIELPLGHAAAAAQ